MRKGRPAANTPRIGRRLIAPALAALLAALTPALALAADPDPALEALRGAVGLAPNTLDGDLHPLVTDAGGAPVLDGEGRVIPVPDGALTVPDAVLALRGRAGALSFPTEINRGDPDLDAGPDLDLKAGRPAEITATAPDPEGHPVAFAWEQTFGDPLDLAGTDTDTVSFTAPEVENPTIAVLRVTASDGLRAAVDDVTLTIQPADVFSGANQPPTADAGADVIVDEETAVSLTGVGADPDLDPIAVSWRQTAGPTVALSGAQSASISFTAPDVTQDATLVFEFSVSDGQVTTTDAVSVAVRFLNQAPLANAGPVITAAEESVVTLDGSLSNDPDGQSLTYAWTQTSGPTAAISSPTSATTNVTLPNVTKTETLFFQLTVSDGSLSSVDSVSVFATFVNAPPVADAGPDASADEETTIVLDGSQSAEPDGQTLSYAWTQTSGPTAAIASPSSATTNVTLPDVTADETLVFQLTVSDGVLAASDTTAISVRFVNRAPAADAGADVAADEGATVSLSGAASSDPDGQTLTYAWTQTSGPTAAIASPTAATTNVTLPDVTTDETLVFQLTVSDGSLTASDSVTVSARFVNQTPTANAGADATADENAVIALSGAASSDPDGQPLSYAWTQTSGPAASIASPSAATTNVTLPDVAADQTLVFQLTVSDGALSDADSVSVSVRYVNRAPVADAGPDATAVPADVVTLDGSASADADGDALSYSWAQLSGPAVTIQDAATASPRFVAPSVTQDATVVLQLTVSDGALSATDTVSILIDFLNTPPVANAGLDRIVSIGASVTLEGGGSFDPDGHPITYAWAQTAGFPPLPLSNANTPTPSFTAPFVIGDQYFTFQLTVSDGEASSTDSVTVKVLFINLPPLANAGADRTVAEGDGVVLDGSASTDIQGQPITYAWTQVGGPAVTLAGADTVTPSFTAPEVTDDVVLTFQLTVSDGALTASDSVAVTVTDLGDPPAADAGPDQDVAGGATVTLDGSASSDPDGDALAFAWTQIAGDAVTLSDPQAAQPTFTAPATAVDLTLTFELIVSDGLYDSSDTVDVVVLGNSPPVAVAGTDQSVDEGSGPALLDGSASSDPDGDALTYAWTQVSGPSVALMGASAAQASFTPPDVTADVVLVFELQVSDGLLADAAQTSVTVRFVNRPPLADAGGDRALAPSTSVTLAGSGSDPDGQAVTFAWSQLAGPAVTLSSTTVAQPQLTLPAVTEDTDLVFQLTVSDGALSTSDTVTITASVSNLPPTADAGADVTADEQTVVALSGAASSDPEEQALAYLWEQISGPAASIAGAATATPDVTLPDVSADAQIVMRLTVNDGSFSASDEMTITVRFVNRAPVANAGPDQSVNEGGLVTLAGGSSADPDGHPITYAWAQLSGPAVTLSSASVPNPTFTAPNVTADATIVWRLTVTDNQTPPLSATDDVVVTVRFVNQPPVANAGQNQTVAPNAFVTLNGSASSDPDGQSLSYLWLQTGGTSVTLSSASSASPTFTAPGGIYDVTMTFQLTVSDGSLSSAATVQVKMDYPNQAPTASAGPDLVVTEGDAVTLNGSASADADGHPLTYLWSQTLGRVVTLATPTTSQSGFTAPQVNEDTTLVIQLRVSDGELFGYDLVTILVKNVNGAPVANAGLDQTAVEGSNVLLSAAASTDPDSAELTFTWTQTAGPTVALSVVHAVETVFTAPDVTASTDLTFKVTVSDGELSSDDTVIVTVTPKNGEPTADAGPDQTVSEGATVFLDGSGSSDPDGDALTHQWAQLSGPAATLSDPAAVSPTFTAPNVTTDVTLLFQLTVSDGVAATVDSVRITVQNQTAATLFVDASNASGVEDGSADHPFNTIAEGVAAAADGAIVQIAAGAYAESLSIVGRTLGLYAPAGPDATSVTGAAGSTVSGGAQVSIDGLTFTGSTSDGLRIVSSAFATLRNCKFTGNLHNGLYGEGVPGLVIADSEFNGNGADGAAESTGALLIDADYLAITGSKFNGNGAGDSHAPPSTVTTVKDVHGNGLAVEDASFVDIQSSEFKDNLWVGLFLNQGTADEAVNLAALTATGNDGAGVVIANAADVTASGGVVSDNGPASGSPDALFGGHGLAMTGVRGVSWTGASEFSRNRGSGVAWGLGSFDQDIALSGATIADNDGHGVAFDFSAGVAISGCTITGNAGFGVGVRSSSNVQVTGNTISLNGDSGVGAINAKNAVTVSGNVAIASNADYGIECGLASALTCSANNLSGNTTGAIKSACGAGCAD